MHRTYVRMNNRNRVNGHSSVTVRTAHPHVRYAVCSNGHRNIFANISAPPYLANVAAPPYPGPKKTKKPKKSPVDYSIGNLAHETIATSAALMRGSHAKAYASRAVQFHSHGGPSDFVWPSARTMHPNGAYVW